MTLCNRGIYQQIVHSIVQEVAQEMYEVDDVTRLCLVALYTKGHVLLEGNPGLGKTELVKTLGRTLQLPDGRIQFTPDLMPSDITGTQMPDPDNVERLKFQHGPLFTSLLLADEVNRATPKTQSAMLEAMAEKQVTVLGVTYGLGGFTYGEHRDRSKVRVVYPSNIDRPFMVLATQNPIDHEGTYDLPEAQSDRFMFKILMPTPDGDTLRRILGKMAGNLGEEERVDGYSASATPTIKSHEASIELFKKINGVLKQDVTPIPKLRTHIINLFLATNKRVDAINGVDAGDKRRLRELVDLLQYGLGPRAASALMLGAKAWALLFSSATEKADGADLARIVLPALRHRVRLGYDFERLYREKHKQVERERLVDYYLQELCVATAPTNGRSDGEYKRIFEQTLQAAIEAGAY